MANTLKYSLGLAKFIADKVEDGISVRSLCTQYKDDNVPTEKQVYRWKKKYPEFKQMLDSAYEDYFFKMIDELNILSKELLELSGSEYKDLSSPDEAKVLYWKHKARQEAIKIRIDTIKFELAKLAPKLVRDLQDNSPSIAIALPTVNIVQYRDNNEKPALE
jgi:hypothetical protein